MGGAELVVPKEYGYVALVLVLYCFLNLWMASQVGKARKKYLSLLLSIPQFFFLFSFLLNISHKSLIGIVNSLVFIFIKYIP